MRPVGAVSPTEARAPFLHPFQPGKPQESRDEGHTATPSPRCRSLWRVPCVLRPSRGTACHGHSGGRLQDGWGLASGRGLWGGVSSCPACRLLGLRCRRPRRGPCFLCLPPSTAVVSWGPPKDRPCWAGEGPLGPRPLGRVGPMLGCCPQPRVRPQAPPGGPRRSGQCLEQQRCFLQDCPSVHLSGSARELSCWWSMLSSKRFPLALAISVNGHGLPRGFYGGRLRGLSPRRLSARPPRNRSCRSPVNGPFQSSSVCSISLTAGSVSLWFFRFPPLLCQVLLSVGEGAANAVLSPPPGLVTESPPSSHLGESI